MAEFILWMNRLPDVALYVLLAVGAGLENVLPAVPADTFVALGGFLAGAGDLEAKWVFLGTWVANVSGALLVFMVSRKHGPSFFERGAGRYVLRPHQMERMARFYDRWGTSAIFCSRFLPGVRAVVPVFAGATNQPWWRVALPIGMASAIWYGGLVQIGLLAGHNVESVMATLSRLDTTVALVAGVVSLVIAVWWVRTRRRPE